MSSLPTLPPGVLSDHLVHGLQTDGSWCSLPGFTQPTPLRQQARRLVPVTHLTACSPLPVAMSGTPGWSKDMIRKKVSRSPSQRQSPQKSEAHDSRAGCVGRDPSTCVAMSYWVSPKASRLLTPLVTKAERLILKRSHGQDFCILTLLLCTGGSYVRKTELAHLPAHTSCRWLAYLPQCTQICWVLG